MVRYVFAAIFLVSAIALTAIALLQHRDGRITGSRLAFHVGGATSSLVAAGGLVLN